MDAFFNALKDTPLSTILVVAGISFLILAVVDQIAGKVVVHPSKRKQATMIGLLLLAAGVSLQLMPRSGSPPPGSTHVGTLDAKESNPDSVAPPAVVSKPPQRPRNEGSDNGAVLNDTITSAKSVGLESTTHEKHKSATDKRYFKFSTSDQPPDKVRVLLRDLKVGTTTWLQMIVYDPDEREIFHDTRFGGNLVFIFSPRANATYYILARQMDSNVEAAEYDLVVSAEQGR